MAGKSGILAPLQRLGPQVWGHKNCLGRNWVLAVTLPPAACGSHCNFSWPERVGRRRRHRDETAGQQQFFFHKKEAVVGSKGWQQQGLPIAGGGHGSPAAASRSALPRVPVGLVCFKQVRGQAGPYPQITLVSQSMWGLWRRSQGNPRTRPSRACTGTV